MKKGTVKFFNHVKGFGFIKEEGTNNEFFVHSTGLIDKIKDNDSVTFDDESDKKGPRAVNVRLS
jgi:CspA family cold shock protein